MSAAIKALSEAVGILVTRSLVDILVRFPPKRTNKLQDKSSFGE